MSHKLLGLSVMQEEMGPTHVYGEGGRRRLIDTGIIWGNPNLFDMMNEGKVDVYIFIFSNYMEFKKKWLRIKMIDKLTTKANSNGYRYHHPKEFN